LDGAYELCVWPLAMRMNTWYPDDCINIEEEDNIFLTVNVVVVVIITLRMQFTNKE